MKILVLGSGNMGAAVVYQLLNYSDVRQVTLLDINERSLATIKHKISTYVSVDRLFTISLNLYGSRELFEVIQNHDIVAAAVPWAATLAAIQVAIKANKPLISITRPPYEQWQLLHQIASQSAAPIILGCGLEPGLTEIFASYVLNELDRPSSLHIRCGGIPSFSSSPLNHKVFFGNKLPFTLRPTYYIKNNTLCETQRFSEVELIEIEEVGTLEAWHDGMLPWLIELPKMRTVYDCTQKTLRWPGFANKVKLLYELGLLSEQSVHLNGCLISPRDFMDKILLSKIIAKETDQDLVYMHVIGSGIKNQKQATLMIKIFDRFDECTGFTAMARTSGFTLASIVYMTAKGKLKGKGLIKIEEIFSSECFQNLIGDLSQVGIQFQSILSYH